MNSRVSSVVSAIRSLADACAPFKKWYWVKYMKKEPDPRQPGMVKGVWTMERVKAYNPDEAAKIVNSKLRPGKNCYVTRVTPGALEGEEDDSI